MRKLFVSLLSLSMLFMFTGCSKEPEVVRPDDPAVKSECVMTYQQYLDADIDGEVVIEAYVQAKQSWWEDSATLYTQDMDGAYFIYNAACDEKTYDKLVPGQKILVNGYKSEYKGNIEVVDATIKLLDGNYIAEPKDVSSYVGTDELIQFQNQLVKFDYITVMSAPNFKWDGSGEEGDDIYFDIGCNGYTITCTVESFLCDSSSEVYQAVKGLQVGDRVDLQGFLYWYDGPNPHITSVTLK